MADDVIIQGFGDERKIPDFATEATQKSLLDVMKAVGIKGLKSEDLEKLIEAISKGDSDIADILKNIETNDTGGIKKLASELQKANEKLTNIRNINRAGEEARDEDAEEIKKIFSEFSGLMTNIKEGLQTGELGLGDTISLVGTGLATLAGPAGKLGAALVGLASAVNGTNQFMLQIGEDRFNLANEIRQSGLAASLSVTESSMISFADMVNRTSFTLGQAAEFANKFSAAVGGTGIERAMQLVEDLAYGGVDGADMMRRFGLEFGGVANVAGQYLETIRNLGMIDRMNNQQLRAGMEDFMDTVTVTSNVLKINIQDAAEMIANTLKQRDDLSAMLAGLPTDLRNNVQNVVAAMGAQGTQFGESIAQFVASGGLTNFLTTEQGQSIAGSSFGQEFLPILQTIGDQILAGGDFGQILASSEDALRGLYNLLGESGFRQMVLQNEDPLIRALGAEIGRIVDNIGDADAGNRADTNRVGLEDDRAFVDRAMVQQEMVLAQENLLTQIGRAADYAENLAQRNADNLALINSVEEAGAQLIGSMGETVADITFGTESALTRFTNAVVGAGGSLLAFVSEDMAIARELVQEQNRRAQEMLGVDPATIEANARREAAIAAQRVQEREIERTVGSDAREIGFNEELVEQSLRFGNEVVPYDTVDEEGNPITERRISTTNSLDPTGAGLDGAGHSYMVIPENEYQRIMAERDVRTQMLGRAEEFGVDSTFASRILRELTSGDTVSNAQDIAELLGANDTSKTFDLTSQQTQAEIAFLSETISELKNRDAISNDTLSQMLEVLREIDTSGFWRTQTTEQRETTEVNRLVAALEQLVDSLNNN